VNLLANLMTSTSLFLGFAALLFSLSGQFSLACWAIIASVVLDGFDGQVARRNPVASPFGKELDSLVDVVSFGVAPAITGYIFICSAFCFYAVLALFIYLFCSVVRLAKYNITPGEELVNHFYGLPTTASGGILASFILVFRDKAMYPELLPFIFMALVVILAWLMVSRARYLNLNGFKKLFGDRFPAVFFILILFLVACAFLKKAGTGILALFVIYLIFSPFVVKRLDS